MGGGDLSSQVHPLAGYIQEQFVMTYTQYESYYWLDAGDMLSAESCILPPALGPYAIRLSDGVAEIATLTTFVPGTELSPTISGPALPATTWPPG